MHSKPGEDRRGDVSGGSSRRLLLRVGERVSRIERSLPAATGRTPGRAVLAAFAAAAVLLPAVAVAAVSAAAAALWTTVSLGALAAAAVAGLYSELDRSRRQLAATEGRLETLEAKLETADADREALEAEFEAYRQHTESSADRIQTALEAAADGDYTHRLASELPAETPGELRGVATAFDALMSEVDETMFNVASFAETVDARSIEAVETADELSSRQAALEETSETLSDRAETEQRRLERANEAISPLSETTDDIVEETEKTQADLEAVAESTAATQTAADAALADLEAATGATGSVAERTARVEASASELDERLDALEELSERAGLVALNATLQAARIESGQAPAPDRLRSLAGSAMAVADTTDVRLAACNELLADIEATNDGIAADAAAAGERARDAADRLETGRGNADDALQAAESAADGVRAIRRNASGAATATDHAADLVGRVASNEWSMEAVETLRDEAAALGEAVDALDDELGTVRTQTGFLQLQVDDIDTSDVESVRSQRATIVDD